MVATVLELTGMTCANCVRHIEQALQHVDGVAAAVVNLATQEARVEHDPVLAPRPALEAAVLAAGYGVIAPPADGVADAAAGGEASGSGRSAAEAAERRELLRALAIAAGATVPLLVLAMSHGALPFADGPVGRVVQMALGTLVLFGPGRRFLTKGLAAARHGTADMNTLVAIGALAAWGWSTIATLAPQWLGNAHPHVYFEAPAAIVTFVLFGKYLETRARWQLGDAVRRLHAMVPKVAHRLAGDPAADTAAEQDVPVTALRPGDLVRVRPGERLPADGVVTAGESAVDESLLSGESVPVDKQPGDRVVGGGLNTSGTLVVRLEQTGAATALSRIAAAVAEAQGSRAPIARFADRASAVFVPIVLAIAALTLVTWLFVLPGATTAQAIERMVAVLVIACPCALGLATPAAVAVGAGRGAELGVLFRSGAALEALSHVDTVFFDKTGTLTRGEPELVVVEPLPGVEVDELLQFAAAAENASEHPFAAAVVRGARGRGLAIPPAVGFRAAAGRGVAARVDVYVVRVGKPEWLAAEGVAVAAASSQLADLAARGISPLLVARDRRLIGCLGVADRVRDEAKQALVALRELGVDLALLSGDRQGVAAAVGRELGIADVAGELSPDDKRQRVAAARAQGHRTAFVGDGVNDAPALAAADVGLAIGTGTDVAAAAADVALLRSGLLAVPRALRLARATMRTIRQNLVWASVYNVVGIPIAAGALYPAFGWQLSPVVASAAMSLSSVSVLLSSLRLRRFDRGVNPTEFDRKPRSVPTGEVA